MYQSNIYEYLEELKEEKLLVCKDDKEAIQIRDVSTLLGFDTFVLPDIRVSVGEDLRTYDEDIQAFFITLSRYNSSLKKKILISPLRTLLIPFPRSEFFQTKHIEFGDTLNLQELKDRLYHWGYHFTDIAGSGKSTIPILKEANQKNIPFRHLKNGIYQLGWGKRSKKINRSMTQNDSFIGGMMSHSKIITASIVREAGLPAPEHIIATSQSEALSAVKKLGWPIVIKPTDQDRGEGVTVNVDNDTKLIDAFIFAEEVSNTKNVIVEKQVEGICCRIFIANQKMLYAVKRLPKSVKGDGKKNVKELIQEANIREDNLPPWKRSEPFPLDDLALESISSVGLSLYSIPTANQVVPLREIESTQWGGVDENVSATIHPDNIDLALRAAELFGLYVAGIDIITPDITIPWYENGAIVNEVNLSPLFGGGEISRRAIPHFLEYYIQGDGRIPINMIVGASEAIEHALSLQKDSIQKGVNHFISSHSKTFSNEGNEVHFNFNTLYHRCRALLMDSRVEVLTLIIQTDELLHNRLPVDKIDDITITSTHLAVHSQPDKQLSNERYKELISLLKSYY